MEVTEKVKSFIVVFIIYDENIFSNDRRTDIGGKWKFLPSWIVESTLAFTNRRM